MAPSLLHLLVKSAIRDNERLVFFAQLSQIDKEGIPRINVKGQQLPITKSNQNAAELVEDVEVR